MKKNTINESVTLKINAKINTLSESGKKVYNLTSGQLNFRPPIDFIKSIDKELNFMKSFQYSPNGGFSELRTKVFNLHKEKRSLSFSQTSFSSIITSGSKFALNLAIGTLINNKEDEIVLLKPYWGSYTEMVKIWSGQIKTVDAFAFNSYVPKLEDIESAITKNTKAIILNSPNNPSGIHYSKKWMQGFCEIIKKHEQVYVISDEVYSKISYFDPAPSYFYQDNEELLRRVVIIDGISKSLASTGLRIGYAIGEKNIISNMIKLQSQLTSAPNSLIQNALIHFDLNSTQEFDSAVKKSIRNCAKILRDSFVENNLSHCWYQTTSAFYYFMDLTKFKVFENRDSSKDHSEEICEKILDEAGVALVPGNYFGISNSARLSLTLEEGSFKDAIKLLMNYLMK